MKAITEVIIKKQRLILLVLFLLSLSLRLFVTIGDYRENGTSDWSDAKYYLSIGQSFAEGDFYPDFSGSYTYLIVGPVLPLLIAASINIFGDPIWPMLFFNCLLSALTVLVMFALGKMLINELSGFVMALWSAFNGSFYMFNNQLIKEPLLIFLVPATLLCLVCLYKKRHVLANLIGSALLFSVLVHTDERLLVFGLPFFIIIVFFSVSVHKIRYIAIWIGVLIISMIPWTIRNYREFNEIVLLTARTTQLTSKIWGSNFANLDFTSDEVLDSNIERWKVRALKAEAKYGISPYKYGKRERYYKNFIHFWKPTYFKLEYIHSGYEPVKWNLSHNLNSILFYGLFIPFYFMGSIYAFLKKNLLVIIIAIIPIYYAFYHTLLLIWPLERYRQPIQFIFVLISLYYLSNAKWFNRILLKNHTKKDYGNLMTNGKSWHKTNKKFSIPASHIIVLLK